MTSTKSILFGVSGCMLLAVSIVFAHAHDQDHELSGIHGIPVEGHDIVAAIEITGTKEVLLSGPGWRKLQERLRENGAELRLGWPLESQTLCRFKEVVLDVMSERGFPDAEISHDMRPTFGNPRDLTLQFTIVEGKRTRRTSVAAPTVSPAQRCMR